MFIVIKSEHYDCTNLICKKDTLEEAVAAVKDSMAQRINKNYHAGLTGTDITHENEDHYGFSFTFDENRNADSSEPRAYSTYDYWNGDDQESVEWVVYEVTTDKPFFLLSYEEYESIELTGFYDSFDEAFEEMKELIAESVNDVFDEDATADDVEDMETDQPLAIIADGIRADGDESKRILLVDEDVTCVKSMNDDYLNRQKAITEKQLSDLSSGIFLQNFDYIVYGKRLASKSENTVEFVENTIVSHNKQELEVVASGMEAMGLSVETGYFDPDDESSVDVSKQLIGFHYVVLKKKV